MLLHGGLRPDPSAHAYCQELFCRGLFGVLFSPPSQVSGGHRPLGGGLCGTLVFSAPVARGARAPSFGAMALRQVSTSVAGARGRSRAFDTKHVKL